MSDARHDQAVSMLTGVDNEIELVIYRETVVPEGDQSEKSVTGEKLSSITQPVITWNESAPSDTQETVDKAQEHQSLVDSGIQGDQMPEANSPSLFSSAIPSSYAPSFSTPAVQPETASKTESSNKSVSPSHIKPSSYQPISSPGVSPRTLSNDWSTPTASVQPQPPKFVYPGFNKSRTPSSSDSKNKTTPSVDLPTPPTNSQVLNNAPNLNLVSSYSNQKPLMNKLQNSTVITTNNSSVKEKQDNEKAVNESVHFSDSDFPKEDVTIVKAGGPLGLSIVGGLDHASHPFGLDKPGVFVSKVSRKLFIKTIFEIMYQKYVNMH